MYALYKLNASDLNASFIETLKELFGDREIEIAVCEVEMNEDDETAYLLRSPANRERLLRAIENAARGENLVEVDLSDLQ